MPFTPRLTVPSKSSRYYNSSDNKLVACGYGMFQNGGNCTAYAWGRFFEILGKIPKLSTGNASAWYGYTQDGYKRGKTPQLGAVICWAKPGSAGHVGIVEKINSDGSIVTSESGWGRAYRGGSIFWTQTRKPPNYMGSPYQFQGFIYNPAVKGLSDKLSQFLSEAESHKGENNKWTCKVSGLSSGQSWCGAFINAVAKTVGGMINTVIPDTFSASAYPRLGVKLKYGKWLSRSPNGGAVEPEPGDLVLFKWANSNESDYDKYSSNHIGIVKDVKDRIITTIEGDSSNSVRINKYSISDRSINGYYRPYWSKVNSNVVNLVTYEPLYDIKNTREDAIVREVAYLNSKYEPSIISSNIRLSMINYTSSISQIFSKSAETGRDDVITDGLNNVTRAIIEFFTGKGFKASVGVGIAANVQAECGFDIGQKVMDSNNKYSYGMCMWNGSNGTAMVNYVGANWQNDLTGQLNFLWYDMTSRNNSWLNFLYRNKYGSSSFIDGLRSIPNTLEGAELATDIFVRCYENPANPSYQSNHRKKFAKQLWESISIQRV